MPSETFGTTSIASLEFALERGSSLMPPFVSVIIPCRNEAVSIERCVASVLAAHYPPERLEVVVADGMSNDGTRGVLQRLASQDRRLRMIDNPMRITPIGLNLAIEAAQGALILRVDAHSVIDADYIPELVRFLEQHPEAWGAGGSMKTEPESRGPFSKAISIVLAHRFGVGNSGFRTGSSESAPYRVDTVFNCCWRRDVFRRVGLFHEKLVRSQDIEMSSRIAAGGGALWLVPQARTTYFARVRFAQYLRHNWSNGVWSLVPAIHLGCLPVRWRHLVPLAFVAGLLGSAALSAAVPPLRWLFPGLLLPYLLANLGVSLHAAAKHREWKLAFLLPIAFAGLHLGYGAGSLWGAIQVILHSSGFSLSEPARTPTT